MGFKEIAIVALILVCIFLLFILRGFLHRKHEEREIKKAGNRGEKLFTDMISGVLRPNDIMLNNVNIEVDGKQTEIDTLIINENGIFIIEVKNYHGTLSGQIDDYSWTKTKISPGGNVFTKEVKNPIKQMKRQTYLLSQYLKSNNIRIWINGYVFFAYQNSPVYDACVLDNIYDFDRIIHQSQERTYNQKIIDRAVSILSWYK